MRKKIVYPIIAFISMFAIHMSYTIWKASHLASAWVDTGTTNWINVYFQTQDYLLGISYALAIAFTVYALMRYIETKRCGVSGILGGVTFTGLLYFGGCFLLGCCGSPMLPVYLSLFGSSFLGFTKPLTFILTIISIIIGYFWIEKKSETDACCETDKCKPNEKKSNKKNRN